MAWIDRRELKKTTKKNGEEVSVIAYRVAWRDPNGHRKSKTFRKLRLAQEFKTGITHSLDVGTYRDPNLGKVTLDWMFQRKMLLKPVAESSRDLYESQWRVHVSPRLGHRRLNTISSHDLDEFFASLRLAGVGEATTYGVYKLVKAVLNLAVRKKHIPYNPVSDVDFSSPKRRKMQTLTPVEVERLATSVPSRYSALIFLLAYCGPRIGEACALRVKHFDDLGRSIRIEEASREVKGGLITTPPKTDSSVRTVSLPSFLADMLAEHVALHSDPTDPDALIFTSERGRQIRQNGFRARILKPALASAGLPGSYRTHDLRHTAAAISIAAGLHPLELSEMLGHSSIKITYDCYGHLFKTLHEKSASRLNRVYLKASKEAQSEATIVKFPDSGDLQGTGS